MSKTVYRRKTLEPQLGYVATQNFIMQQAKRGIDSPLRTSRVVRVWSGEGKRKVLEEVIVAQ